MALYRVAIATGATAAAAAIAQLKSAASDRIYVREIGVFCNAATQSQIGLVRSATLGTATTTVLGQACDPAEPAGTGALESAWSAAPTIGAIYLARFVLPAAIGAGIIIPFQPRELILNAATGLCLWNFGAAANSVLQLHVVWEE